MPQGSAIVLGTADRASFADPRSEAVKAKLAGAARQLGDSGKPCTVSSLVRAAGVSRSAFYVHFDDLADFASHLQRTALQEISAAAAIQRHADPAEAMLHAQRRLVAHVDANRELYRTVGALGGAAEVATDTTAVLAASLRQHFRELAEVPQAINCRLVASYIAHAVTGMLAERLRDPEPADAEVCAQHLLMMLPPWTYGAVEPAVGDAGGAMENKGVHHEGITGP